MTTTERHDEMRNDAVYDETGWHEAGLSAWFAWDQLRGARNLVEQADAIEKLSNAMSDLASWLLGYSARYGDITDPRGEFAPEPGHQP